MDKEDMVQIYNGIVLSLLFIQNKEIMPFAATRMDLVSVILSEVSQTKTNMVSLTCGILKMVQMSLPAKQI